MYAYLYVLFYFVPPPPPLSNWFFLHLSERKPRLTASWSCDAFYRTHFEIVQPYLCFGCFKSCSTTRRVTETADRSQQTQKKNDKKTEKKKYVPVVSEALIGEEKNLGRIFLISRKFRCFSFSVRRKKTCFIYFYFCNIYLMLVIGRRNGK